ncbi:MAG: alpha-amylase family glycosyl hydrolase [Burkholderiaceae bacterium]
MTDLPVPHSTGRRALSLLAAIALLAGCTALPAPPQPGVDIGPVVQLPRPDPLPAGWEHGAFMEVFVRGYQDSDGDGIGDLRGLTQRLDYLQRLGVRGLWLMPVTASADHDHGYGVVDYRAVERDYGTLANFDELVRQAHARGIGIVLDYVINHSARENPLFRASAASPASPWRDWYVWEPVAPAGWRIFDQDPWTTTPNGAYFAQFGAAMPDFNLRNPKVVAYHLDSLRFWLNHGVDGFRIDAVGHLFENGPQGWSLQPENYAFLRRLRDALDIDHRHVMVCESPGDPAGFARESACGSAFAFGHSGDLVQAGRGDEAAIRRVADYFLTAPEGMATMVSNHDAFAGPRLWDALDGDAARVRAAAAAYLLQPGTPYLYYGEELGMSHAREAGRDAQLRGPMSWTPDGGFSTGTPFRHPSANVATNNAQAESADPGSMLAFYTAMLALRNAHPSIALGRYLSPHVDGRVMSFQRAHGGERTLVVINYGDAAGTARIPEWPSNRRLQRLYPAPAAAAQARLAPARDGDTALVPAPALSVQVFEVAD